jgi:hypothetical protein
MPWKVKAIIDGKEQEVEISTLPDGVIPQEQFDVRFRDELSRRTEGVRKSLRSDLLKDEEFKTEALEAWKKGPSKQKTDDELAALRAAWEKENVEPLKKQLGDRETLIGKLRERELLGAIATKAASLGVRKEFLTPPREGADPLVVAMMRSLFAHDEKTDSWAVKKGDGFEFASKATDAAPYKGVDEFMTEWAGRDESKPFLDTSQQKGPGLGTLGQRGGVVRISVDDARNHDKFIAAEAEAEKIGGRVEVVRQ